MNEKRSYPFATVGGLVIAHDQEILLVQSHKWKDLYSLPGGKIEKGETREEAFRREVREETALEVEKVSFAYVQESIFSEEFHEPNHFIMNDFISHLHPKFSKEDVKLNDEAYAYLWIDPKEALRLSLQRECRRLIEWYLKAPPPRLATIGVEGYQVECIIGILPHERLEEQPLVIDISFHLDLSDCFRTGSIETTVDYTLLSALAKELALKNRYKLIETFANDFLNEAFHRFPFVWGKITIRKPKAIPSAQNAFVTLESSSERIKK